MCGDLGSMGSAQAMLCIPLSWEGNASSLGASITSCCWAGQCWFLECAGNRQLLGKPQGKCQERKNTITWNNCRTRVRKAPPDPSWRPLRARSAPLPAAPGRRSDVSSQPCSPHFRIRVLPRKGPAPFCAGQSTAQCCAQVQPSLAPCLPHLAGISSHIWLEPAELGLAGRSGRAGGCCPCHGQC